MNLTATYTGDTCGGVFEQIDSLWTVYLNDREICRIDWLCAEYLDRKTCVRDWMSANYDDPENESPNKWKFLDFIEEALALTVNRALDDIGAYFRVTTNDMPALFNARDPYVGYYTIVNEMYADKFEFNHYDEAI